MGSAKHQQEKLHQALPQDSNHDGEGDTGQAEWQGAGRRLRMQRSFTGRPFWMLSEQEKLRHRPLPGPMRPALQPPTREASKEMLPFSSGGQ